MYMVALIAVFLAACADPAPAPARKALPSVAQLAAQLAPPPAPPAPSR